ncbi:MAG: cohesin domain-containing protein [Candidatus Pacebacteria bacterium]|nr:cohesin domain-containing protein [Candidatus Paceibacterota bacterium]
MIKIQKKIIILLSTFSFLFSGPFVFAAEISFNTKVQEVAVGQQFQMEMLLNTDNEAINAIEGEITFPIDLLELEEVRDANSIVNFWVDKPKIESDGQIAFSGIIPGGYQGPRGLLFTLIFVSKKEGQATIELHEAKTLLNDGKGTEALLSISPYQFTISQAARVSSVSSIIDKEPPESFAPAIAQNPAIANGKWFLVFATQDKRLGIDHYEIKETQQRFLDIFSKWISRESPYILQDQELRSYVFVKAVDKAGNERIVKINPRNPLGWYENYENWLIIILGLAIAYTIKKFLWRRYLKK